MISNLHNLQSYVQKAFSEVYSNNSGYESEISVIDKDSHKSLSQTIKSIIKNGISPDFSAQIKQLFENMSLYEHLVE